MDDLRDRQEPAHGAPFGAQIYRDTLIRVLPELGLPAVGRGDQADAPLDNPDVGRYGPGGGPMRLLSVAVPDGKRADVERVLEEADVLYTIVDETSGRDYDAVAFVLATIEAVENITDRLESLDVRRDGYLAIVEAEAILSEGFDRRQEDQVESQVDEASGRISRDELRARATELAPITPTYVLFTVVSAVIATAGVLLDSAAVVVGAMVIAPLIGPAIGTSVGSILADNDLFRTGARSQLVGLALAVASAVAFGVLIRATILPHAQIRPIEQVAERMNPGALALVIALGAGIAGAFSMTTVSSTALVGVMIAAALVPPAATIGLGVAYADATVTISAAVILLINVLSINVAGIATLWARGYRPANWRSERRAEQVTVKRVAALVVGLLILSSVLVATSVNVKENSEFEHDVRQVVEGTDARVVSVDYSYRSELFLRYPTAVTVHTLGDSIEAAALRDRILERTGDDVTVIVILERGDVASSTDGWDTSDESAIGSIEREASGAAVRR